MNRGAIAVTGGSGRLGQAVIHELRSRGRAVKAWSRPEYDLDDSRAAMLLMERDSPELIIHAAAWVDVDGCARDPDLARRRNATAVSELASAARQSGADLVLLSTNEVFDGLRMDGAPYSESDEPRPANPYGKSKLGGEIAAAKQLKGSSSRLWIVRTAWLYGSAGNDFPSKILAAADRPGDEPLRVVDDEIGNPTYTKDLAAAIVALPASAPPGTYHVVGVAALSRHAWASDLLHRSGVHKQVVRISSREFTRASSPPAWGVLDVSKAARYGITLRGWNDAADDFLTRSR